MALPSGIVGDCGAVDVRLSSKLAIEPEREEPTFVCNKKKKDKLAIFKKLN